MLMEFISSRYGRILFNGEKTRIKNVGLKIINTKKKKKKAVIGNNLRLD